MTRRKLHRHFIETTNWQHGWTGFFLFVLAMALGVGYHAFMIYVLGAGPLG